MAVFVVLYLFVSFRPSLSSNPALMFVCVSMILVHNFGAFWMIYQAIRCEWRVGRYFLLFFVPFMFIWYRFVRYPLRQELLRLP